MMDEKLWTQVNYKYCKIISNLNISLKNNLHVLD